MKARVTPRAEEVPIHTEYIRLQDFLKFAGLAETGGAAKIMVQGGEVRVNGEICRERGRKLRPGASVSCPAGQARVGGAAP